MMRMMYMSIFWNYKLKYNRSFQKYDADDELALEVVSEMVYFGDRVYELKLMVAEEYLS